MIVSNLMDSFKKEGLVLVPENAAVFALQYAAERKKAFKKTAVTPHTIVKYKMLNTNPTVRTIKNMVKDGRIGVEEHYRDSKDHLYVLVSAIKRINSS
jgi:hypothetical protein